MCLHTCVMSLTTEMIKTSLSHVSHIPHMSCNSDSVMFDIQ